MKNLVIITFLLFFGVPCYAQEADNYTLLVGEFEFKSDTSNPLLSDLTDVLTRRLFHNRLVGISPVSSGLRSAYLQRARNEQPEADITQISLLAGKYAGANAVLVGSYSRTGSQRFMKAQLYIIHDAGQAREDIELINEDTYRLLDDLTAEVNRKLGGGKYNLLSTKSWEAYEAYRKGHQAYYNFNTMGAIDYFQQAIELDPRLAIAQAELGLTYGMISKHDDARAMFTKAMENLTFASKLEQAIVKALRNYHRIWYSVRSSTAGRTLSGIRYDTPRMRDDKLWDEPWIYWYVVRGDEDSRATNDEYAHWLSLANAYFEAGFYDASRLTDIIGMCDMAFSETSDQQFLEAAIYFTKKTADIDPNDQYNDIWRNWLIATLYTGADKNEDAQKHIDLWLQAIKLKPANALPPAILNNIAANCLNIGKLGDALKFAEKAVELESDLSSRTEYRLTLADIYLESVMLDKAFDTYLDIFHIFMQGNIDTLLMANSLIGLAKIINVHPEFIDKVKRVKLDEVMKAIKTMDPLIFRSDTADRTIGGGTFPRTNRFCAAMEDMNPIVAIVRGLIEAETQLSEKVVFIAYLAAISDDLTKSELELLEKFRTENNGFELGTSSQWRIYGNVSTQTVVTELVGAVVSEEPPEGKYCLNIKVNELVPNFWNIGLICRGYIFQGGKRYTLSAFLKCRKGEFKINFIPALAVEPYTGYGEKIFAMTDTWAEYHITTPPMPETVKPAMITFHLGFGIGEFWIDKIRFYEGEYVPYEKSMDQ